MHSHLSLELDDRAAARGGVWLRLLDGLKARRVQGMGARLSLVVLLCLTSLLATGVVQAAHVHDAPISLGADKHVLLAPADVCPLCTATHVAVPVSTVRTVQPMPRTERLVVGVRWMRPPAQRLSYELFSRPPPAGESTRF